MWPRQAVRITSENCHEANVEQVIGRTVDRIATIGGRRASSRGWAGGLAPLEPAHVPAARPMDSNHTEHGSKLT